MYPIYKYVDPNAFHLHADDVNGIVSLYGRKKSDKPTIVKDLPCPSGMSFDAVTTYKEGILFFQTKYVWIQVKLEDEAQPIYISTYWPFLPNNTDAAYEYLDVENYTLIVFKGRKYWIINGASLAKGFPKDILQLGFPDSVKKIDAAVHNKNTGKTYFFKGDKYWRAPLFLGWPAYVPIQYGKKQGRTRDEKEHMVQML